MTKWASEPLAMEAIRRDDFLFTFARNLCAILLLLLALGCGSRRDAPATKLANGPANGRAILANEATLEIKSYKVEELTATGDEFLIDEGRVEVAPPVEWNRLPRSDKYLVCFTRSDRTGLPRIALTAEGFESAVFKNVTGDNLVEFAKFRQVELTGGDEPTKLLENVRPLQLGENFWIRYVRAASFRNAGAERQILETVHEGRLYVMELQVVAGTLKDHRDAAYAVGAKLKFVDAAVAPPVETPPEGAPSTGSENKVEPKAEAKPETKPEAGAEGPKPPEKAP